MPLFWPLLPLHVKLPPWLVTGSWLEAVVLFLALAGLFLYATGGPLPLTAALA